MIHIGDPKYNTFDEANHTKTEARRRATENINHPVRNTFWLPEESCLCIQTGSQLTQAGMSKLFVDQPRVWAFEIDKQKYPRMKTKLDSLGYDHESICGDLLETFPKDVDFEYGFADFTDNCDEFTAFAIRDTILPRMTKISTLCVTHMVALRGKATSRLMVNAEKEFDHPRYADVFTTALRKDDQTGTRTQLGIYLSMLRNRSGKVYTWNYVNSRSRGNTAMTLFRFELTGTNRSPEWPSLEKLLGR